MARIWMEPTQCRQLHRARGKAPRCIIHTTRRQGVTSAISIMLNNPHEKEESPVHLKNPNARTFVVLEDEMKSVGHTTLNY